MNNILITGSSGFVGVNLLKKLDKLNYNLITPRSFEYDLRKQDECEKLFVDNEIDCVIHLAATCGGIGANMKSPGRFFYDNITMGVNVIENCRKFQTQKIIFLGTVCSYPKHCAVPFREIDIWNGYPEETNAPYGVAKKSLYVMLDAYSQQYGLNSTILVPSNLYGPHDNFEDDSSHVIPALIKKIYKAKTNQKSSVEIWGDGTASREFLYVEDLVQAITLSIKLQTITKPINIGTGKEITIKELAYKIKDILDYQGDLSFNKKYPNGQPRRCVDTNMAKNMLNFDHITDLDTGLERSIDWFVKRCI